MAVLAASAAVTPPPPPAPTPWPERLHAVLFTNNMTTSGGELRMTDLYYDFPGGRNLNLVNRQLAADDPVYDVEWTNGTSYYFDSTSCRTILFPVGILPPDWLAAGAVYLGREVVEGFDCHVWTKVDFIWYYEDVVTHRPVRWNFYTGMQQHVMSFEVGGVLEDSKWQAPAYCFNNDTTTNSVTVNNKIDSEIDVMSSFLRFVGGQQTAMAATLQGLSVVRMSHIPHFVASAPVCSLIMLQCLN